MGWSGRAPAPPAIECLEGGAKEGARHVPETRERNGRDRYRSPRRYGGTAADEEVLATKTTDQLDLQALHRVRERLVSESSIKSAPSFWSATLQCARVTIFTWRTTAHPGHATRCPVASYVLLVQAAWVVQTKPHGKSNRLRVILPSKTKPRTAFANQLEEQEIAT
jgi:hypothetical protein